MAGAETVLLDGGMGQELVMRSAQGAKPLWGAQVLRDEPHLVEALHGEFIAAGADVITINAYSATRRRLARAGVEDAFEDLQRRAVALAESARAGADRPVRLAGCLPPLIGSYHPDQAPPFEESLAEFRELAALQAPHVDVILIETMASVAEARAATQAAAETGLPTWTALTVDDQDGARLRSGEPVVDGAEAARAAGAEAVLINCSTPEAVSAGLAALTLAPGLADAVSLGAYANAFVSVSALELTGTVDVLEHRTDLDPAAYAAFALDWAGSGARIVGGCCHVGPAHIAEIARRLGR